MTHCLRWSRSVMGDVDTTGPGGARRAPTLADVLCDGRHAVFAAGALVVSGGHLSSVGASSGCLSSEAWSGRRGTTLPFAPRSHRVGPRCRVVDTTEHHHGVRVGRLFFGELDSFSAARFALVATALVLVLVGCSDRELARERPAKALVPGAAPASGRKPAGATTQAGQAASAATGASSNRRACSGPAPQECCGAVTLCRPSGQRYRRRWPISPCSRHPRCRACPGAACGRAGPAEPEGHHCAVDGRVAVRHRQPGPAWLGPGWALVSASPSPS